MPYSMPKFDYHFLRHPVYLNSVFIGLQCCQCIGEQHQTATLCKSSAFTPLALTESPIPRSKQMASEEPEMETDDAISLCNNR